MKNRAVFLDRDGTIAPDVNYCSRPEDFNLFPDAGQAIKLLNDNGFKVFIVTNQSGIARGYFTEATLASIHQKMTDELKRQGARLDGIYYCPHHPDDGCECRKPKTVLFQKAAHDMDIDLRQSFVVGDAPIDIESGKALGSKTILVTTGPKKDTKINITPDFTADSLIEAARYILKITSST